MWNLRYSSSMAVDRNFLTIEQEVRESVVIAECNRLMRDERSRYESQAAILLETGSFSRQNGNYLIRYKVKDNRFAWQANPSTAVENSYSGETPVPDSDDEKIEQLIELFAHTEAGFIS